MQSHPEGSRTQSSAFPAAAIRTDLLLLCQTDSQAAVVESLGNQIETDTVPLSTTRKQRSQLTSSFYLPL